MNLGYPMQSATTQNDTVAITLIPQTGMPVINQHRSKELAYDSLLNDFRFIFNPYGPQILAASRPNHHW